MAGNAQTAQHAALAHRGPHKIISPAVAAVLKGRGGPGRGQGRKPGSLNSNSKEDIKRAKLTGMLPHEILLEVSRGNKINGVTPTLEQTLRAARDAAPYYAHRLSSIELVQGLTDADLDQIISRAAAEAGLSISFAGEAAQAAIATASASSGAAITSAIRRPLLPSNERGAAVPRPVEAGPV